MLIGGSMLFVIGMFAGGGTAFLVNKFFCYFTPFIVGTTNPTIDRIIDKRINAIKEPNSLSNEAINMKIKNQMVDINKVSYTIFGIQFHPRDLICIYSKEGYGKTFFAIFIAKKINKKALYLNFDDPSDKQIRRFESASSIIYISYQYLADALDTMKNEAAIDCNIQSGVSEIAKLLGLKVFNDQKSGAEKNMRKIGINDSRKIDNILLLNRFANFSICFDAEVIIIDSLSGLFPDNCNYNRSILERITQPFRDRNQMVIFLHHTNKAEVAAGNCDLLRFMDIKIRLDKPGKRYKLASNFRIINPEKVRDQEDVPPFPVRIVSEGPFSVDFELADLPSKEKKSKKDSFKDIVLDLLKGKPFILKSDLLSAHKEMEGSILNTLRNLEKMGLVSKADGKHWHIIKNLMYEDQVQA
jgi:hypothetical protein